MNHFSLCADAVDVALLHADMQRPGSGGFCAFEGWVRNSNEGREVDGLEYEAYLELALTEGERIVAEAIACYGVNATHCMHRTGHLKVGELAVWVGVSSAHRDEAFRACRYIIDEIKRRLPVWKKEHYVDGDTAWVACAHVQREHVHEYWHPQDHAPNVYVTKPPFVPDYSRQTRLRDVGEAGQAKLAASRVLVIGAGGLGCPVISYLAGAGVGMLGIVDGDRLDASNLHRQTMYDARDIGELKVVLAARRVAALNPAVAVRTYTEPLRASNIDEVFAFYDVVVECSDDMRSRYLCNDAAVTVGIPLVLASTYQYEGQLQVVSAKPGEPCLRCLWPQEPAPGIAGSCVESGVLGPVPGVLGAMQATEALKLLLDLPRPVDHALLLVSLLDQTAQRLPIDAARGCDLHGGCIEVAKRALALAQEDELIDLAFDDLADAIEAGFVLVDVREPDEILAQPLPVPSRTLPSTQIEARAVELPRERVLLVCASGRRSGHAARLLRGHGFDNAHSLIGGIAALHGQHVSVRG